MLRRVFDFILHFVRFLKFSGYQFLLSILCYVFLYKYIISSFENIKTDFKIGIFPIPIAYWSGFGILKQDWDGSDSLKTGR